MAKLTDAQEKLHQIEKENEKQENAPFWNSFVKAFEAPDRMLLLSSNLDRDFFFTLTNRC